MSNASPVAIWRHTLASVQFLSRLPVHRIITSDEQVDFAQSAYTFPIAGLIIGLPSGFMLWAALSLDLTFWVAAIVTVVTQILVTGALHEDGLADVADGFWGGYTRQRKLDIMRDSATGTYGTLALVCSNLLRLALLIHVISHFELLESVAIYVAFESLSRLAILSPWNALQPARKETASDEEKPGLSARYGAPGLADFIRAAAYSLPSVILILFIAGIGPALTSFLVGGIAVLIVVRLAQHHIGGHTGDVLGATQQFSLLGLYMGLAAAI